MKRSSYKSKRHSKFNIIKTILKILIVLKILAIIILLVTPSPSFKDGFKNLRELQTYASQTNEQTPMENADTLKPEFTKYYQSQIPTFSQKIKNKIKLLLYVLKISKKPVWSVSFFKNILQKTNKDRENAGYKDNLIYKIQTDPTSKFVIFGNMQGAFHSLVRCLTKIKELGIIGDDLKVTNSNNYIIFMGDLVDRSPFTLETLSVALKLLELNPQNVIYLRGNHESKDYWQEHTLKTELQVRATHLSQDPIPLQKDVSAFFNSLPIAIYLSIPKTQNEFVRMSEYARSENETLTEANYVDFLTKQQSAKLEHFVIKEKGEIKPEVTVSIKATIRNEKKRKTFQKMEGLRLLPPDMDAISWNVLSCPTVVYQKALDFHNDAFALLSAAEEIENWEITLFSHDVRTKDPFKETKYNFISGLDLDSYKSKINNAQKTPKPQAVAQTPPQQPIAQQPTQQVVTQQPQAQPVQVQQPVQTQVVQPQVVQPQVVQTPAQVIVTQPVAPQLVAQQPAQQIIQQPTAQQPVIPHPTPQVVVTPQPQAQPVQVQQPAQPVTPQEPTPITPKQ